MVRKATFNKSRARNALPAKAKGRARGNSTTRSNSRRGARSVERSPAPSKRNRSGSRTRNKSRSRNAASSSGDLNRIRALLPTVSHVVRSGSALVDTELRRQHELIPINGMDVEFKCGVNKPILWRWDAPASAKELRIHNFVLNVERNGVPKNSLIGQLWIVLVKQDALPYSIKVADPKKDADEEEEAIKQDTDRFWKEIDTLITTNGYAKKFEFEDIPQVVTLKFSREYQNDSFDTNDDMFDDFGVLAKFVVRLKPNASFSDNAIYMTLNPFLEISSMKRI